MWTSSNNYSFDPDFIDRETVIVLGAGASCHLGFPLGSELIRNIIRNTNEQRSKLFTYLEAMGFSTERIREFNRVLQESNSGSIDAFLADYHSFLDIGRAELYPKVVFKGLK